MPRFMRVTSDDPIPKLYDHVPENTDFVVKLYENGECVEDFGYVLKKDKPLPYSNSLMGRKVNFSRSLEIEVVGYRKSEDGISFYKVDGTPSTELRDDCAGSSENNNRLVKGGHKQPMTRSSINDKEASIRKSKRKSSSLKNSQIVSLLDDDEGSGLSDEESQERAVPNLEVENGRDVIVSEIQGDNQGPNIFGDHLPSLEPEENFDNSAPYADEISRRQDQEALVSRSTAHNSPNWLSNLIKNFEKEIIQECSPRTKIAVHENREITETSKREYKAIKDEIINQVMLYLKKYFSSDKDLPKKDDMINIAVTLGTIYPYMFQNNGDVARPGAHVPDRPTVLGAKMRERLRGQLREECKCKRRNTSEDEDESDSRASKRGKRVKKVYGVDNNVIQNARKAKPAVATKIRSSNYEMDFNARESIYAECRSEMTAEIIEINRTGKGKGIPTFSRGFWKHHSHSANQFSYMTGSSPLTETVEKNYRFQYEVIEDVVRAVKSDREFKEELMDIEAECELNYNGSTTHKEIFIFRTACRHFDKGKGYEFIRLPTDGLPQTLSPHIYAEKLNSEYICEVWVEKEKVLGNLSLPLAISSLLHICFIFDLKYPEGAETILDWIQHNFAEYGDDSGTRTGVRVGKAQKNREMIRSVYGKVCIKKAQNQAQDK